MEVSKTKSSFYRRLYVAWLIDSQTASSVPALTEVTGMPRRTAQDTIAALADLDIICEFEQQDGARNHAGRYLIRSWGGYPEGVAFAVLLMNAVTPLIERATPPRIYGRSREGKPLEAKA